MWIYMFSVSVSDEGDEIDEDDDDGEEEEDDDDDDGVIDVSLAEVRYFV